MKKITVAFCLLASALLFFSCGQEYHAMTLAKEFMKQHAIDPDKFSDCDFVRFDSTRYISDSLLQVLQQKGHMHYKRNIDDPTQSAGRILYTLRMNYVYEGDTLQQTFYMDEQMQHVVAIK